MEKKERGHSIPVDVELEKKTPPDILWHGTGEKYVASISSMGLIPKSRLYVHLSFDYDTAIKVGSRHGNPYVYQVDAKKMNDDGFDFFISVNGVWLTKTVPVEYLKSVTSGRFS
jgi:putative RNA 2'-phosphotransferase